MPIRIARTVIFLEIILLSGLSLGSLEMARALTQTSAMTEEEASQLVEEFGIVVGAVDEDIQ